MTDEKPYPWHPGYPANEIYDNLPRTHVPSFANEEIKTPDIPHPDYDPAAAGNLLWGGFPTLAEKLYFWRTERKRLKGMSPMDRAQYKAWQKFQKDQGKKHG